MPKRRKSSRRRKKRTRSGSSQVGFFDTIAHLFHPRRSNNHRPRVLHPEAIVYFVIIVIGVYALLHTFRFFPKVRDSVLGFASNITPEQVIELTNQERQKSGFDSLIYNEQLSQAALAKAQDMFDDQYWAHTAPDGKEPWAFIKEANYTYTVAGENLARDFADSPTMVVAWMNSPTHRANIMNPKYQEIGIAVVDGKLEGFETTLVVQMFGKAKSATAQVNKEAVLAEETVPVTLEETVPIYQATDKENGVLASALIPIGSLRSHPLFTPLQITKAIFLSIIMLIILTLLYDSLVIGHKKTARLVGKNLAHIILFTCVAFLVVFFKGGMIE